MLNRLQAASRLLILASLALFTAVVLLLIQSAFWSTHVSAWMQAIIFATALLSYFRPQYGLLALAVLAPLGQVGSRTLDSNMRGAEALVLAFLAGALVRGWTLREFRTFPSMRLEIAALIFAFVVAASCLEQIWFLQIRRDFPWPFTQELFSYASRNYLTDYRDFSMIFRAMLLIEGLALMVYTLRYARRATQFPERLVLMIIVGAVATALLTIGHIVSQVRDVGNSQSSLFARLFAERWTAHTGDVNAAGAFFAMGMVIAAALAWRAHPHRPWLIGAASVLAIVMVMARSRTALGGVMLTLACLVSAATIGRVIGIAKAVTIAMVATLALAVTAWHVLGPDYFGSGAVIAVRVRWLFLGTTWRMLLAEPLFGIGIGQYFLWSESFATPEMFQYYRQENAHNNFAQVAGELGTIGILTFVIVLILALKRIDAKGSSRFAMAVWLGLALFILTWLGNHPLLVPEVAIPFWLTLGVAGAFAAVDSNTRHSSLAAVVLAFSLVSIPFRVSEKSSQIDFSRVNYGVSTRQTMTSRARLFIPATERHIELPLRARTADDNDPIEIDVFVDGLASQAITLNSRDWQRARIELVGEASGRFRQIDLQIKPLTVDDVDTRPPVEVGNWEIISKPNG